MGLQEINFYGLYLELAGALFLSVDALGLKNRMDRNLEYHIGERDKLYRNFVNGLKTITPLTEVIEGNITIGFGIKFYFGLLLSFTFTSVKLLLRHIWILYLSFLNKRIGWIGFSFLFFGFIFQAYVNFKLIP